MLKFLPPAAQLQASPFKDVRYGVHGGAIGVDALIQAVPEIKEVAHVSGEQVVNIGVPEYE